VNQNRRTRKNPHFVQEVYAEVARQQSEHLRANEELLVLLGGRLLKDHLKCV
jgi:hypothetical protein